MGEASTGISFAADLHCEVAGVNAFQQVCCMLMNSLIELNYLQFFVFSVLNLECI